MIGTCALCERVGIDLTIHHLIPRTVHDNTWFKKRYSTDEMKTRTINVCKICHFKIHELATEKELGRNFNTLELLKDNAEIQKFLVFARKQKY